MDHDATDDALKKWGSRQEAVEFPHSMNVTAYIMKEFGIPRQWHRDDLIYHYTNAAGLHGILGDRKFWATKAPLLNDLTEVSYAFDVVTSILRRHSQGSGPVAEIATAVLPKINFPASDIYVTSFCRDGDLLSQWRGYGAFGGGFALGFSFALGNTPPIQMAWLIEVLYERNSLAQAIDEILGIFAEHLEKSTRPRPMESVIDLFPECLHILRLAFKHPAYMEEQEVRLLGHRSSNAEHRKQDAESFGKVYYRTSGNDVIPFLQIGMHFPDEPAPPLPLRRIVIGPGVSFERNKEAIEQMLADFGYNCVEIVPSCVPFAP